MAATDATPFPMKNVAYRVTFPILDADGDLVSGASGLDSEVSKDGGTFADATNDATEIASSSGMYYLDLTSTEMNADTVAIIVKSSSGKTTPIVLYPQEGGDINVDVTHINGSAVNTGAAQLGVNAVQAGGTAWGSGAITAGSIAADAFTAAKFHSDVTTEFQSGLATGAALQVVDDLVDDLEARLTAARAGYLDNLSGGAVALASALSIVAGYLDTEIAAIKAKTDNLPSDPADDSDIDAQLAAIAGYLDTEIAAIKAKTDYLPSAAAGAAGGVFIAGSNAATTVNLTGNLSGSVGSVTGSVGGNVTGSVGSLAAQAKADVNAEVVDALAVDTYAEPGGVPGATSSLKDKIGWLFMLARNKRLTTASTDKVRNDADSGDVATATLSDDGTTFSRGEYS